MTKKRKPANRSKPKSKSKSRKAASSRKPSRKSAVNSPAVKILNLNLPPDAGVRVGVAPGHPMPVILADPVKREVVLLPVPVEKKKGFWETIFGG